MEASSVFSKSCERSVEPAVFAGVIAGVKTAHAPHSSATATHDTAARQNPRTHQSMFCGATRDAASFNSEA